MFLVNTVVQKKWFICFTDYCFHSRVQLWQLPWAAQLSGMQSIDLGGVREETEMAGTRLSMLNSPLIVQF